ncbi:MAG: amino acid adenylation domain-containing protein [Okeania sp. SIO2C9]|nr:amino acid adenylation domain-containing protein [Okeania sp. SIO2C9]
MSEGQKGLWFIHQIAPENIIYNEYNAVKINSPLDIETWKATWQKIVERHAILRTTYGTDKEGEPVQIIHPTMNVPMQVIDAKNWSEERLKPEILACVDVIYDLEKDPIIRLYLFQRSATEWVQMFTIHQIASDSFSKDLFFKEFQQLYAGIPVKEPLAYTDFVNWESQMLNSPRGEKLWQYWEKQLAGELQILDLPTDLPRPSVVTYQFESYEFKLNEELISRLKQLQCDSINLLKIALSAFYVLLYRYTNQEDIIVNIPTENRGGKKEFKDVAGNLASLVVVRGNLEGNTTFKDLLMQVAQTVDEALKHEAYNYPWSQLVKELKLKSNFRHGLVSSVMFNWRKLGWYETEFQEGLLQIEPYLLEQQHGTPYDLCVEMIEVGNELNVRWNYNGDLFKSETIERMARHYLTLLEGIVANPETPIFKLPLLSESERHQLLIEWNNTTVDYPKDKCIHQLFEEQVEKTPDAVAVVLESEQLTYHDLNCRANQLAHYLQLKGVGPEVLVGICVERSLEMVVGVLGILKAGGAYVPLDPTYPQERLVYMIEDTQAPVILTQKRLQTIFDDLKAQIVYLDSQWQEIAQQPDINPQTQVQAENLLYVIYTSGSTGRPKGTALSHGALSNLIQWHLDTLLQGVGVLQFASLSFDASFHEIFAAWSSGGTLYLISESLRKDLDKLLYFVADNPIQKVILPVVVLQQWAERYRQQEHLFQNLKEIITTGEQLQVTQPIVELFKRLKGCSLHNHYGPSETHVVTAFTFTGKPEVWSFYPPLGKPIANTQMYILDPNLTPVPVGVHGELYIGGANLARCYLGRPDLTAKKFIPDPFSKLSDARLYKTGDLTRYLPDGNIEFLGRIDHQVKIRGFRVELGEIEAVLSKHPLVSQAIAIVQGEKADEKRLIAYVVPYQEQTVTDSSLRHFIYKHLPDYMIPAAFVLLDALPLNPNGKVDRKALPIPEFTRSELSNAFVAPRSPAEEVVAQMWSEVLGVEKIGINDNFFTLGGNSLNATGIFSQLRQVFDFEFPLMKLFQNPTVCGLVEAMAESGGGQEVIDEIARTFQAIDRLSPEEVAAMLAEMNENS